MFTYVDIKGKERFETRHQAINTGFLKRDEIEGGDNY